MRQYHHIAMRGGKSLLPISPIIKLA